MLGSTLWFVVVIGLLATVLIDAGAAFGRAGVHAAADHAIESGMRDAVADYQNTLQTAIASDPSAINTGLPLQRTLPPAAGTGPRFTLTYSVTPTTVAPPSCSPTSPGAGADTIRWLQCNGFVRESRMSLHVSVGVLDAGGAQLLAVRDGYVTLRLFGEAPYSAIVGWKDGAAARPDGADALTLPPHEGDVGGDTLSGAVPQPPVSPADWPAGGTLIHVRYECHDGAGSCAGAAPPDPDAGLHANVPWTNGNQPSP